MNSITPITTLTVAINKCLKKNNQIATLETITDDDIKDVLINTDLIEERSVGLQNFVEKYKSLTRIKSLETSKFSIFELLNSSLSIFKNEIGQKSVRVELKVNPEKLEIEADKNLVEQVIINLIKNSLEAFNTSTDNQITLSAGYNTENRIEIILKDNGSGIPDDQIDEIFLPFFTTKEQGSGIGLSLARQIMRLHNGNIYVQSDQNSETIFTLEF